MSRFVAGFQYLSSLMARPTNISLLVQPKISPVRLSFAAPYSFVQSEDQILRAASPAYAKGSKFDLNSIHSDLQAAQPFRLILLIGSNN